MKKLEFRRKYEQNGGSYQQESVDKEGGLRGEGMGGYRITGL